MKLSLRVLGILAFILLVILLNVDFSRIGKIILSADPLYVLFAIIMLLPMYVIKTAKWRYLLSANGIQYPFRRAMEVYWIGVFVGIITPGRLGDFIKVLYLKKDKDMAFGRSFATVLIDRISDVILLLASAILSMSAFAYAFSKQMDFLVVSLLGLVAIIVLLSARKSTSKKVLHKAIDLLVPKKYRDQMKGGLSETYGSIVSMKARDILIVSLLTVIYWGLFFFQMHLLSVSLGLGLSLFNTVVCLSLSTTLTMIPISISGIGTRDAVFILIFSMIGLSSEAAISFSLSVLFIHFTTAFVGLLFWLKNPVRVGLEVLKE